MSKRPVALAALILVLVGTLLSGLAPHRISASSASTVDIPDRATSLSPYWKSRIQRWTPLIVQEAQRRELDPDLLAALIWKESRGDPNAIGPSGSVGLMQVMPKEAGFNWRPSRTELLDPNLNVAWGTRTLSIILRQGEGDLFRALAAYNGGWRLSTAGGPTRFAASILLDYARAVAARHEVEGAWVAYLVVQDELGSGPLYAIHGATGEVVLSAEDAVSLPASAPLTEVASVVDEEGAPDCSVGLWMYSEARQAWLGVREATPATPEAVASEAQVIRPMTSSPSIMAGSAAPEDMDAAGDEVTDVPLAGLGAPPDGSGPPDPLPAPTRDPACAGGPLRVDAWPLDRVNTEDGWTALVFVEGRGAECAYTYAWNDASQVKGEAMRGSMAFYVTSQRRSDPILGTVVVTSGKQTTRVALYILPPGD